MIIPCVEEFSVKGRFFTLNKQALVQALRDEDFMMRIDVDVKATCSLDILDMFFICVITLDVKHSEPLLIIFF